MIYAFSHTTAAAFWLTDQAVHYTRGIPSNAAKPAFPEVEGLAHFLISKRTKPSAPPCESPCIFHFNRFDPTKDIFYAEWPPLPLLVSPELCYLQVASMCDLHTVARFGSELCALFVRSNNTIEPRKPLTSVAKLKRFLKSHRGTSGLRRARKALDYVFENARSPREIELALIFTIPCVYGGFGFPRPQINARVKLSRAAAHLDTRSYFECDLVWLKERVVVEYDGEKDHSSNFNRAKDSSKRNALQFLGYSVLTVTSGQVSTYQNTIALAKELAKELSLPFRPRVRGFYEKSIALWTALFSSSDPNRWLAKGTVA